MRLEEYWGVGPKTSATLEEALGVEGAIEAIDTADVGAIVDAGIPRGRATRILRRANGEAGMNTLATGDTRAVYDDLLGLAAEFAVTSHAGDRIRVLTPLADRAEQRRRLDDVLDARDAWEDLDDTDRADVLRAFREYDDAGASDRAAVEAALTLRDAGLTGHTFEALADMDEEGLADAANALGDIRYTDDGVEVLDGVDAELDRLRSQLEEARTLENAAFDVIDSVRDDDVRDLESFQQGVVDHVASRTGIAAATVRSAAADDAVDVADFVSRTLRTLVSDLETQVEERAQSVADSKREHIGDTTGDVAAAVDAISDIAFRLSLGRFASAHDLTRPTLVDDGLAVSGARNLFLSADVQPISYAVGTHGLTDPRPTTPPSGDRVTVLTGANSGGKTTLLETLCSIGLLASMGLPVPAEDAEVGHFDRIVFHRRHASFNAGVLESTLKSVIPPLVEDGRTLMLVDEFEAITEPGRAADLLNGLVNLTVDRAALGVYVTHLADELSPLPEEARIDGIFAEGLTRDLALQVDYQPRFGTVGKSTPEFIVSRLVANATDRTVRQGFEELAAAVGESAVQRTLSDALWDGGS